MSFYQGLKQSIHGVTRWVGYLGMFLLIPMMLLTFADVIARKATMLGLSPVPGAFELSSYMLSVFVLLGVAYTQQMKGHVRVTMLTSRLPSAAVELLNILTTLLSIFIMAVLCWQGWVVGLEETSVSDMLRIPQLPFRLLVSVAGGLMCLELLLDLIESVRKLTGVES